MIILLYSHSGALSIKKSAKGCPRADLRLFAAVLVERRIARVEILRVQLILRYAESFAEPLIMHYLTLSEEADRVAHIGVVCEAEDVVVGGASLLLGSHILVQVGDDVALGLEVGRGEGGSRGCDGIDSRGVVDEVGVEAACLYLVDREVLCELIEYRRYHLDVGELLRTSMIYTSRKK